MKFVLLILLVAVCNCSQIALNRVERQAEPAKPEAEKPEATKPEEAKTEEAKPKEATPEEAKPEAQKAKDKPVKTELAEAPSKQAEQEPVTSEEASGAQAEYLAQTFKSIFGEIKTSITDPQTFEVKKKSYTVTGLSNVALVENPTFNIRRRGNREIIVAKFTIGPVTFEGGDIPEPVQATPSGQVQVRIVKKDGVPNIAVNSLKFNQLTRKDLGLKEKPREEVAPVLSLVRTVFNKNNYPKELKEAILTQITNEINKEKLINIPRSDANTK